MADRWLTFDCFGTLIDWRHGIRTTGELLFPGHGAEFLDSYATIEAEVETEGSFRRYRAVMTETVRRVARRLSLDLKPDDATALVSTIPYWPPFADVGPALSALRREGWKLALLTNCDRDIIALTQRRLPVSFDAVVTAEDVAAYKPSPAHFLCSSPLSAPLPMSGSTSRRATSTTSAPPASSAFAASGSTARARPTIRLSPTPW